MLDLQFKYNPWITLTMLHHYYEDQAARDFRLVPTSDTRRIAQKTGLLIRDTLNGIIILYDSLNTDALLDYLDMNKEIRLAFYLYFTDPYLFTYTNLPLHLNSNAYVFYFSNTGNPSEKNLHEGAFASEQEAYPAKPLSLELSYEKAPKEVSLRDQKNTLLTLEPLASQKYTLDLRAFNDGKYTLFENTKAKESFVLLKTDSIKRPFALLDLTIEQEQAKEILQHIQHMEAIPERTYAIALDTRHTYWKYYIVPKYVEGLESLFIDTGDKEIKFSGPKLTQLPNGAQAYLFESEQALALKEESPYKFQLIKQKDAKGKDAKRILLRLPSPNLGSIKPESRDKHAKVYSEIIVYI